MVINKPISVTDPAKYFLQPEPPKQRQYEALRAFYVEKRPSAEVARAFGYSPGAFRVLCHAFCHTPQPTFFLTSRPGPRFQPKKSAARELIHTLRKQNLSIYEISEALKAQNLPLSST